MGRSRAVDGVGNSQTTASCPPHPQPRRRRGYVSSSPTPRQQLLSFSKTDATMCVGASYSPQADPQVCTLLLPIRGPKDGANLNVCFDFCAMEMYCPELPLLAHQYTGLSISYLMGVIYDGSLIDPRR